MKRCFYIANAYDGSYFFVSDNVEDYYQKLAGYALNLKNSQKLNHYTFGSVEMTEDEYAEHREGAGKLESDQISMREKQEERQKELLDKHLDEFDEDEKTLADAPTPLPTKKKPHLRLV